MDEKIPEKWYIECKTEEEKVALMLYAGFSWKAGFIYQDEKGDKTFSDTLVENDRGTEITYDYFKKHLLVPSEPLPDGRWYVWLDPTNRALVNEWKLKQTYDDDLFTHPDYTYVTDNGGAGDFHSKSQVGYEEITTQQFIDYVLNATPPPPQSYEYLAELFTALNIQ